MRVPGFTAEGSLVLARGHYRAGGPASPGQEGAVLLQAAHRHPTVLVEQQTPDPPLHCTGAFDCIQMVAGGDCPGGPGSALCTSAECWC